MKCVVCPAGSMCPIANASSPTPCPAGSYQALPGRTACTACGDGKTSSAGATGCATCASQTCSLSINNTCGLGCGLNQFWTADGGCQVI